MLGELLEEVARDLNMSCEVDQEVMLMMYLDMSPEIVPLARLCVVQEANVIKE